MCVYTHIQTHTYTHTYTHIYIERESEWGEIANITLKSNSKINSKMTLKTNLKAQTCKLPVSRFIDRHVIYI